MRNSLLGAAMLLFAVRLTAGSVSSIEPATILVDSGEYFLTANGTGLGDQIVYSGAAGTFTIDVTGVDLSGNVTAWIPQEVIHSSGSYSVVVKGGTGDSAPTTFKVLKSWKPPLRLHFPEVVTAIAKSRLGSLIEYDVTVSGGDPGSARIQCDPKSGSTFPYGLSTIRCFATDDLDGRDEGSVAVNVWDATPPKVYVPKSFEVETDSSEGAYVKYDAWAEDDIDEKVTVQCLPESGKVFVPGRTRVVCEALDASLNPGSGMFEVMVRPRDTGKLELKVPEDFKVGAPSKDGTFVEFEVFAFGSADPDPVVECSPPSGSFFELGSNKVLCFATDDFDQRAEAGFVIDVYDASELRMSDVSAEATSADGADVEFEKKAEEWSAEITCSREPGSRFALGATTVDCHSTNDAGRRFEGSFTVTVADTIAPHVAEVRAIAGEADVNQNVVVTVEVAVVDAVDTMPRCAVSGIEGGDGRALSDLTVSLRGDVAGRDFKLQVTCSDSAGNRSAGSVAIRVGGHGRRKAATN